jgi:hypothetical protein
VHSAQHEGAVNRVELYAHGSIDTTDSVRFHIFDLQFLLAEPAFAALNSVSVIDKSVDNFSQRTIVTFAKGEQRTSQKMLISTDRARL